MKKIFILILSSLILLSACIHPRYINAPTVPNTTFFREKGDFKLSGALGTNILADINNSFSNKDSFDKANKGYNFSGQAAYAITNHLLVAGSFSYSQEQDNFRKDDLGFVDVSNEVKYHRTLFDFSAGYYKSISVNHKAYFNGLAGVAFGKIKSDDYSMPVILDRNRYYDANILKYYVSPSFNFFFSDIARLSFSPKISFLQFTNIHTNYTQEEEAILGYNRMRSNLYFLFEPSVVFQTGLRKLPWLRFDTGLHFAAIPFKSNNANINNHTNNLSYHNIRTRGFLFSVGLSFYPFEK